MFSALLMWMSWVSSSVEFYWSSFLSVLLAKRHKCPKPLSYNVHAEIIAAFNSSLSDSSPHLSSMRTGTKVNLTATSCPARTVLWWFGTTAATGAMSRVTTTCPTPARRECVSNCQLHFYSSAPSSSLTNKFMSPPLSLMRRTPPHRPR